MIVRPLHLAYLPMPSDPRHQGGFTFIWLLFLVAGLGVSMAAVGTLWHTAAQREKETELLFVGDQYRRAIESFWKSSPKGEKRLPNSLDELLLDPRFPHTVRHLRRLYLDPVTGKDEWGLLRNPANGISGVYSLSDATPMKRMNFPGVYGQFEAAKNYQGWGFRFDVPVASQAVNAEGLKADGADGSVQPAEDPGAIKKRMACMDARDKGFILCRKPGVDRVSCEDKLWREFASCDGD